MVNNGKIKLLENIEIDKKLPKFNDINSSNDGNSWVSNDRLIVSSNSNWNLSGSESHKNTLYSLEYLYSNKPSLSLKIKIIAYKKLFKKQLKYKNEISSSDLKIFFDSIKTKISNLDSNDIDDVLDNYENALNNAKLNNQTALVEKIIDYSKILKYELILSKSIFNKYINESELVNFYNIATHHDKYKTKLTLTYIKNFIKVIPHDVCELRQSADDLKVFDNYIILHYNYNNDSVSETKEELEKKKDPILFGVIQGSTKLYYIGDWVDEYCDLTFDSLIKKLGKKKNSNILNNNTMINNIKNI